MKLAFITPTAYIKKYGSQGDFTMALSHLMDRENINEYERNIKEAGLDIFLDNGCFEKGHPEGIDSLFIKAQRIKAKLIFAPDHLFDAKATEASVLNTIDIKKKMGHETDIAAIPQADNLEEYLKLYKKFNDNDEIKMIGISYLACSGSLTRVGKKEKFIVKLSERKYTDDRIEVMKALIGLNLDNYKPAHLLGLGDSYRDVKFAQENCPWILYNDTSSPFWNGVQDKKILENGSVEGGKTKVSVDFDCDGLSQAQLILAQHNINQVKRYICN